MSDSSKIENGDDRSPDDLLTEQELADIGKAADELEDIVRRARAARTIGDVMRLDQEVAGSMVAAARGEPRGGPG